MIVSIHQPDFFPWQGFWAKMIKSNSMVILDHTSNNPRDANSWLRRVKLFMGHEPNWFGISLLKVEGKLGVPISEIQINVKGSMFEKSLMTITQTYKRAPYFNETIEIVENYFFHPSDRLLDRNMWFISRIIDLNHIKTNIVYSSSLECQHASTEMLIEIVKKSSATSYLSGDGAAGYMDVSLFEKNDIELKYNNFAPLPYGQFNSSRFVAGLSIIDYSMNYGPTTIKSFLTTMDQ